MKKYKITKKFPFDDGKEYQLMPGCIEAWLEKGWIKELQHKACVIDKSDNWKMFKLKKDSITAFDQDCKKFKSKKEALEYVLNEAKDRFNNCKNILQKRDNNRCTFYFKKISIFKGCITDGISELWNQENGWIAEPIKEKKYPKSVDDLKDFAPEVHYYDDIYGNINTSYGRHYFKDKNTYTTEKTAEAIIQLTELIKFRDLWWQVDGWKPSWDACHAKYTIENINGKIEVFVQYTTSSPLAFKDKETAKDFLETFKQQINIAKEFI